MKVQLNLFHVFRRGTHIYDCRGNPLSVLKTTRPGGWNVQVRDPSSSSIIEDYYERTLLRAMWIAWRRRRVVLTPAE